MVKKVFIAIVCLVVGIILCTTILPDTILEATTDDFDENFTVSTGAGVTSTTEELTYEHYYGDQTSLSATSDNESDTPAILDYDDDTYEVTVGGLAESDSRILTISYVRDAHTQFTGFSSFVRFLPFLMIVGLVVACIWVFFAGRSKGGD